MSVRRKRQLDIDSSSTSVPKKQAVQKWTIEEWISQHDKQLNTSIWLKFSMADRDHHYVASLWCLVCTHLRANSSQWETSGLHLSMVLPMFISQQSRIMLWWTCTLEQCCCITSNHQLTYAATIQSQGSLSHVSMDAATKEEICRSLT